MKIAEVAEKLLEHLQMRKHPIPIESVAQKLGAKVTYQAFDSKDNLSGVLFKDGDKITIAVNSKDPRTRQRFTIAHECGHIVLKHKGDIFVDQTIRLTRDGKSSLAVDPFEIEANRFAAELLMPKSLLLKEFETRLKSKNMKAEALIKELATAFDVSAQAMEYRLENLGLLYPDH